MPSPRALDQQGRGGPPGGYPGDPGDPGQPRTSRQMAEGQMPVEYQDYQGVVGPPMGVYDQQNQQYQQYPQQYPQYQQPMPGAGMGQFDAPAPGQPPPKVKKSSSSLGSMRKTLPPWYGQYLVGVIEVIKLIHWFTELLKVLCGKDAAGDYFPWAVFTLVMASWLLIHRAFDQVGMLVLANGWAGEYLCCLMSTTCPCACPFFPLANLTFCLYRKEHPNAVHDERAIFAQRPLSTVMLGLPFSGVMSMFLADAELVMHPAQVHIRAMQAMYQTVFLNIPDFVVDLVIILNAPEDSPTVGWFYVSFFYSIVELMTVCLMTVRHIHEAEKKKPLPPRQQTYRY